MDGAYFMVDKRTSKIKYCSARLMVILIKKSGIKLCPKNNISLGFPFYNVGALEDHEISFAQGDTLVILNEELMRQQGGAHGKKLGAKSVAGLLKENIQKPWGNRSEHIEKVLKKWVGNGKTDDLIVAQVKL